MSNEHDKAKTGETKDKTAPFAACMEHVMFACGPEMKKWMEACASNTGEVCFSCCSTQVEKVNAEQSYQK